MTGACTCRSGASLKGQRGTCPDGKRWNGAKEPHRRRLPQGCGTRSTQPPCCIGAANCHRFRRRNHCRLHCVSPGTAGPRCCCCRLNRALAAHCTLVAASACASFWWHCLGSGGAWCLVADEGPASSSAAAARSAHCLPRVSAAAAAAPARTRQGAALIAGASQTARAWPPQPQPRALCHRESS